jgi:hypothetical protein
MEGVIMSQTITLGGKYRLRRGYVMAQSTGENIRVTYCRPKNRNDLRRHGRELSISIGNASMTLNGKHLRCIKQVLAATGEI